MFTLNGVTRPVKSPHAEAESSPYSNLLYDNQSADSVNRVATLSHAEKIPAPPADVLNSLQPPTDDQLRRNTGRELGAWCSDADKARFAAVHRIQAAD
jgi:hypothetical protein